jgi:anti-sigma factor ChrR (cupin superfamily)
MKKIRWMLVLPLLTGALAVTSTARADKPAKEIVVTPSADVKYMPLDPNDKEGKGPQISVVFGDMKKKGTPLGFFLKVPPGFKPGPHTHTSDDYAVVVQGAMHNFAAGGDEGKAADVGGTWFQPGKVPHDNHCASTTPCVIFVYVPKGFDFLPVKAAGAEKAEKKAPEKK